MRLNLGKNKFKLLLIFIIIITLTDIFLHKGLLRFLIPKDFENYKIGNIEPLKNNYLINRNKNWVKAVNTTYKMETIEKEISGIELDIYYDTLKNIFDVHHDPDNSIGQNFEDLLIIYKRKRLEASLWIDFKNLQLSNSSKSMKLLTALSMKYQLQNKILVESSHPNLLQIFSQNQFYTSYYVPSFNPYLSSNKNNKVMLDSITLLLKKYPVNAISGYYYQMPFLHHYFPSFPILSWAPNDKWSFVNWFYKNNINSDSTAFIVLYN